MHKIEVITADITQLKVDAIVNAANNALMGGGGVDGAIHKAAGIELQAACRELRGCATGESKITKGYNLPATYIIHTVGPVWNNGTQNEEALLENCYSTSLHLATQYGIKTIAFPSISTGAYRFPFQKAVVIAYRTISNYLEKNNSIEKVFLVFYSEKDLEQYNHVIQNRL